MKLKKKIMLVLSMALLSLSVFLPTLQVEAATTVFDYTYSRGFLLPKTYCDTNTTTSANYEEGYLINTYSDGNNGLTMNSETYYCVLSVGGLTISNESYEKAPADVEPYGYFLYAGEKYYVAKDGVASFVVQGNDYNAFSFYLGANVSVSPYKPGDGYVYANSYQCRINVSQRLRVIKLNFNEVASEVQLYALNEKLATLNSIMSQNQTLYQTYFPKLTEILLNLNQINLDIDELIALCDDILLELQKANITLDSIDDELVISNTTLSSILRTLNQFHNDMISQSNADKNITDGFKQDSDSQSSELNDLNQQTQVDRIDVDNASGTVDDNLDLDVDSNYGVLLSTFTSNDKILTMLLAVSSIGLISYVLFGKR